MMVRRVLLIAATVSTLLSHAATAGDWPHWRGPNRNDVVDEPSGWTGDDWPLEELWKQNVGEGSTSPLIVGDRLYTVGWRSNKDHVQCLDVATGETDWSVDYDCPKYGRLATGDQAIFSGVTSTPEYDPATGLLFTLSVDGHLNCWDTQKRGKHVWGSNLYETFDVPQRPKVGRSGLRDYGYTGSSLLYSDWVIVEVGAKQGNLMAFDRQTGTLAWKSQNTSPGGHTGGPALMTVDGVPCVAVHNFAGLLVARLDKGHEGETVATYDWITSYANNIAAATMHNNHVLLTSAYNQYKITNLKISLKGAQVVWEQKFASKVCSPVVRDGNIYLAWQTVMCLDAKTGKQKWKGGRTGDQGSIVVTSDDRLVIWGNHGDLLLAESATRSPKKYTQLAAKEKLGSSDAWPHIVLANGHLFCKDRDGNILCYRVN
ncbi:PQQ-binding-like beta-propeller repeat protein [Fuerstiella marisgermanici]|uniref:Outer membrane biogenesis protein n=1 Tax=Fuerstiella marisgermanici TaxID=1891926 RepID=A0A1P8WEV4_9PLAN|nr:PQQ-binding-like beta-propeller repeat protein [Fuerstiella marisgermanici]APZ92580.1 outer membrane biogenesis protein [Fuerstiella marisgermanici]